MKYFGGSGTKFQISLFICSSIFLFLLSTLPTTMTSTKLQRRSQNKFSQDNIQEINTDETIPVAEIEDQMLSFINKLRKIETSQDKIIMKGDVPMKKIKVNSVYDLRESLAPYFQLFNQINKRKTNEVSDIQGRLDKYESNIKDISGKLSLLQANYETVIAKSQIAAKDLAEKKKSEIEITSELDSIKANFELENEKFLNMLKNSQFKKDLDLTELSIKTLPNIKESNSNPLISYNSALKDLYSNLNIRKDNVRSIVDLKKQVSKEEANLEHYDSISKSSGYDAKLFSLIINNMKENFEKFREEIEKKLLSLVQLKKSLDERTSSLTLNAEKSQAVENLQMTKRKVSDMEEEVKLLNSETEKLLKKKNKLRSQYNQLSMEQDLRMKESSKKNSVLEEEIDKLEIKKNEIVKAQNKYLDDEFNKLKNLILVLNKLLLNFKQQQRSGGAMNSGNSSLLNNLLFDNNIIDLQNGVNVNLLDEVTNNIINIK